MKIILFALGVLQYVVATPSGKCLAPVSEAVMPKGMDADAKRIWLQYLKEYEGAYSVQNFRIAQKYGVFDKKWGEIYEHFLRLPHTLIGEASSQDEVKIKENQIHHVEKAIESWVGLFISVTNTLFIFEKMFDGLDSKRILIAGDPNQNLGLCCYYYLKNNPDLIFLITGQDTSSARSLPFFVPSGNNEEVSWRDENNPSFDTLLIPYALPEDSSFEGMRHYMQSLRRKTNRILDEGWIVLEIPEERMFDPIASYLFTAPTQKTEHSYLDYSYVPLAREFDLIKMKVLSFTKSEWEERLSFIESRLEELSRLPYDAQDLTESLLENPSWHDSPEIFFDILERSGVSIVSPLKDELWPKIENLVQTEVFLITDPHGDIPAKLKELKLPLDRDTILLEAAFGEDDKTWEYWLGMSLDEFKKIKTFKEILGTQRNANTPIVMGNKEVIFLLIMMGKKEEGLLAYLSGFKQDIFWLRHLLALDDFRQFLKNEGYPLLSEESRKAFPQKDFVSEVSRIAQVKHHTLLSEKKEQVLIHDVWTFLLNRGFKSTITAIKTHPLFVNLYRWLRLHGHLAYPVGDTGILITNSFSPFSKDVQTNISLDYAPSVLSQIRQAEKLLRKINQKGTDFVLHNPDLFFFKELFEFGMNMKSPDKTERVSDRSTHLAISSLAFDPKIWDTEILTRGSDANLSTLFLGSRGPDVLNLSFWSMTATKGGKTTELVGAPFHQRRVLGHFLRRVVLSAAQTLALRRALQREPLPRDEHKRSA